MHLLKDQHPVIMESFPTTATDLYSPFCSTEAGVGDPVTFECPNPMCGIALADHNSVCDHLAVPGSPCTLWAMEYVESILDQGPEDDGDIPSPFPYLRYALTCR